MAYRTSGAAACRSLSRSPCACESPPPAPRPWSRRSSHRAHLIELSASALAPGCSVDKGASFGAAGMGAILGERIEQQSAGANDRDPAPPSVHTRRHNPTGQARWAQGGKGLGALRSVCRNRKALGSQHRIADRLPPCSSTAYCRQPRRRAPVRQYQSNAGCWMLARKTGRQWAFHRDTHQD